MKQATITAAIAKLRQTYAGDLADLIWEKSVKGCDSVLAYNPDSDELEIHVFSPGTVWNDQSRSLYLRRFADPLNIEVMDWSDLGDEFREYDGEQELSDFAAERGIDLDERFRNIHDYYLVEDGDIVKELLEELLRQFAEWQDGEQTNVWIDTEGETTEHNAYYIDTVAGTMRDGAGNSRTEEFFGNVHPAAINNIGSCIEFWLAEGWLAEGDVVKWDGVQVFPGGEQ